MSTQVQYNAVLYCTIQLNSWLSKVWRNAVVFQSFKEKCLKWESADDNITLSDTIFFEIESQFLNMLWEDNFFILIYDDGSSMVPLLNMSN